MLRSACRRSATSAAAWSRFMASMTIEPWSIRPAHRTLLDAFGALDVKAARVRSAFASYKVAERTHADEAARIGKAQADADYLHHVQAELAKLAPLQGEEEQLSERRIAMQQAGKVSGDLRDAFESVGGEASPLTTFSALLASPRAPCRTGAGTDRTVVSRRSTACWWRLDHAQTTVEDALAAGRTRSARARKPSKSACSP